MLLNGTVRFQSSKSVEKDSKKRMGVLSFLYYIIGKLYFRKSTMFFAFPAVNFKIIEKNSQINC